MQSFLESRIQISLLVGALCTYALSKTFDRAYWSFIHGWTDWQDTMEESLESTAHLMVLVLVAASYWNWGCLERGGRAVQGPRTRRVTVWALLGGSAIAAVLTTSRWYVETPKLPRARFAAFPAELSSLCNVGSELGHNLFLASSDEAHKLTIWALDENQTPSVIQHVELKIPITDENSLHLDDLEDIAWDERGTYYAISSHRHIVPSEDAARRKKSQGTECALVSFQLNRDEERFVVTNARLVTQSLLAKIRELGVFPSIDWQRSKVFSWRGLVKTWQLDIEGLAYVDKKLLIGFKNPIEGGRATILSYDIESDELSVAARPEFGGHGILGMHYDSCSNALYVLANHPIKHRFDDSCLWVGTRDQASGKWSFSLDRKYLVEAARLKTRRKASGMTTRDGTVAICFDSETESPIKVLALDDLMQPRKLR
jgi:hypothetical protein